MNDTATPGHSRPTVPLVIISPVRDEAALISKTLDSIVAQTVWPLEWVIVDDGSTDDTASIVQQYADKYPFIHLVTIKDRGFRKLGGGVVAAFKFGLMQVKTPHPEYVAKLDGDMSFGIHYLEIMFKAFAANPRLAAVSGKVFRPEDGKLIEELIIDEHVAGQFKLYRWSAFCDIGGFVEEVLWDGIDVHTARMKGWHTESFDDPDARLIHHRLMGSSDKNVYRGRLRLGRGIYFMGYHPLYALASGIFRMREKPFVIGGLLIMAGFIKAFFQQVPRYDNPEFRAYLQNWQLKELKAKFWR
ncbi:MAG: glycosyltransferase family 2 protein [Rhodoferax sp.]|nr:glycosyltransferase family 2 protein [Rhodoferax sp.]